MSDANATSALITHATTLHASVVALRDAKTSQQPPIVLRQLAQRAMESVEQIELTLGPIVSHLRRVLADAK